LKTNPKFLSTAAEDNQIPITTGIVYIDNDPAITEKDIENSIGLAYPALKFFFKNVAKVPTAKYVVLNDDGTYDLLARRSLGEDELFFPDPSTLISSNILKNYDTRSQYDFYGWSDKPFSPQAVNDLNDEEWYLESKNNLIIKTSIDTIEDDVTYNNWNTLSREAGKYDYTFYATYYIHKYRMHYIDGDGNEVTTVYVPANSSIINYTPNILPTKDDSNFEDITLTYKWIGWAFIPEGKVEEWSEKNIGRASKDRSFYAVFEEASVYDNILDD